MARRHTLLVGTLLLGAVTLTTAQSTVVHTFDQIAVGARPPGFTTAAFRQSSPGDWRVARIAGGLALHHPRRADADGWSLALAPDTAPAALRLTARVRLAGGRHTGGLVWHYQDARNFMAVLLDLDDGELDLYRVTDGNRIRLEDRDGLELDPQAWHTLRVVHDAGRTVVSIGGIRVLDRQERRASSRPGRVGVVATGGSDAAFDDLRIESASGRQKD
jgi:hypothetical protein